MDAKDGRETVGVTFLETADGAATFFTIGVADRLAGTGASALTQMNTVSQIRPIRIAPAQPRAERAGSAHRSLAALGHRRRIQQGRQAVQGPTRSDHRARPDHELEQDAFRGDYGCRCEAGVVGGAQAEGLGAGV